MKPDYSKYFAKPNSNKPRFRNPTMFDVMRARDTAVEESVRMVRVMFFTVLLDKQGYDEPRLKQVWHQLEDLADSIKRGYVNLDDLKSVLSDEYGIVL